MLYCANNNTVYKSVREAVHDLGIAESSIHRYLNGERKTAASYVFMKLDDISPESIKAARAWLLYSAFKIVLDVSDDPIIYKKEGD